MLTLFAGPRRWWRTGTKLGLLGVIGAVVALTIATVGGLAPAAFEALAEALCRLPVIDHIAGATRLEEYGLAPAAGEIHVVAGSQESRLLIGMPTPASNLMYVRFADRGEVLKIGVELASNVERVARFAQTGDGA